jgi:NAD-dependent deacetylase
MVENGEDLQYFRSVMDAKIKELADRIRESGYAVALTGAGVSTESGIPDFRSPRSGLWTQASPMEVASVEGFLSNPQRFYEFWRERFAKLTDAEPNITHKVLAKLEAQEKLKAVITQNIDGLHRKAGSKRVIEVHGSYAQGVCVQCGRRYAIEDILAKSEQSGVPHCDGCNGLLKPDVVLFGELLPPAFSEAEREAARCDLLLVLGSSLEVYPVAGLVPRAKHSGARVAILNRDPTEFDSIADLVIHARLGPTMERLAELLGLEL